MNKLVSLSKFSGSGKKLPMLSDASVVVDERGIPLGFFFGRDSLISLLSKIDEQFENKVGNQRLAYDNYAGRIIDLIEEKLPVRPEFVDDLKRSIADAKKQGWVSMNELRSTLNV
ncbi:MAG: hypothetical protein M1484_00760 [Patescibacteria group bacterium]|nr:hypothetical protein [Patescibacteria group bacterium]MCL5431610.1 hypothetical protein [Patescibacteria group bacterium]